jgi:hypothetical protein
VNCGTREIAVGDVSGVTVRSAARLVSDAPLAPAATDEESMHLFRHLCLSLALATIPLGAPAQNDIVIETDEPFAFDLRMSISAGTQSVYCYQLMDEVVVGSVTVSAGSTAIVPVTLPDPVIRCAACNSWGCSTLSPNAAVLVPSNPLDLDLNGLVTVTDILVCSKRIQEEIF